MHYSSGSGRSSSVILLFLLGVVLEEIDTSLDSPSQ